MSMSRMFLYGFMALLISGCGQTVTETLHVPASAPAPVVCETDKTIVALPFADYSNADDLASVQQRSMIIMEALTDNLVAKGFRMPVQEDVFGYLVDKQIISQAAPGGSQALANELNNNWSDAMKATLSDIMATEDRMAGMKAAADSPLAAPGVHALDRNAVADLGKAFNADYVVRGRVVNYRIGKAHTWEPTRIGILPFVYNGVSRSVFGIAKSETYDNLDAIALGALIGGIAGYNGDYPYEPEVMTTTITGTTSTTTTTGTSDAADTNALLWGAVGATAAHLAKNGGDTPEAVVQLRVWVQDTSTGEVVWTNRVEVKVAPESVFGDTRQEALLERAVNNAVSTLVDDFWTKTKAQM